MFFRFLFSLLVVISTCAAIRQTLTLYDRPNQKGNSVTFTEKFPDLSQWTYFTSRAKSYCATGWWVVHPLAHYHGGNIYRYGSSAKKVCGVFSPYAGFEVESASARYLGPSDTSTSSISFYSEEYERGQEIVVEIAPRSIPFHPKCMFVTGTTQTSWTLYEGYNFDGNSICYKSPGDVEVIYVIDYNQLGLNTVGSVVRGCK